VKVLQKLGVWVKEVKLNRNEVNIKLLLATDGYGNTTWHQALEDGSLEILETFWCCAKEVDIQQVWEK